MRNRSQKNAETLLLEPTKNKEKKLPQERQTFAQRKTWKPASHQTKPMKNVLGTPLRNCSLKNPETLLLEPTKKTFGTHKKQCFGNRCRQPSRKACARCLWRSGSDRLTQRKKSHGGPPSSSPPPFDHNLLQQLPRRAPPHSDEGSADIYTIYIYIEIQNIHGNIIEPRMSISLFLVRFCQCHRFPFIYQKQKYGQFFFQLFQSDCWLSSNSMAFDAAVFGSFTLRTQPSQRHRYETINLGY